MVHVEKETLWYDTVSLTQYHTCDNKDIGCSTYLYVLLEVEVYGIILQVLENVAMTDK